MLRSPMCRIIIGVVLFLCLPAVYSLTSAPKQTVAPAVSKIKNDQTFVVTRVVDGDTLVLSNGQKVRLTGIDTPESGNNAKTRRDSQRTGQDVQTITGQGKEAARFVRKMIEGKEVRLEFDVQKHDRYGRELVYVYDVETLKFHPEFKAQQGVLATSDNEIFLNGSIIRSGYAMPMTIPPNVKHADLFKKLYQEAKTNKRGLWAKSESE
jgi:micrococcal nuclease